jgi:hypothetical protein
MGQERNARAQVGALHRKRAGGLNRWLGRESGLKQPVHVSHAGEPDLTADLKAGLKAAQKHRSRK